MSTWWATVTSSTYFDITVRLLLAMVLGGLIGLERDKRDLPAGFRTHILVCLGSALIMLISIYGFEDVMHRRNIQADPARLAAQVVSGIGFLGAGTILVNGFAIRGLTTAASLWVVAGIGLAAGAGFYFGAVLTTALVLFILVLLNRLESWYVSHRRLRRLVVRVVDQPGQLARIANLLSNYGVVVRRIDVEDVHGKGDKPSVDITLSLLFPPDQSPLFVVERLRDLDGVRDVSLL
ncbi:MAG: MgtC/SapB family protein [Calditerricola sp.]|nr:MgtC/SapB family protein [Calditerricola sp.]